ncbi:MAG TPA: class I SAM-dependent methyltransferase [Kofleriaceae bacterium]
MTEREQFLRAFHDAQPGITSRAFGRAGSYARLAAKVPQGRVLDLACGDGTLLQLLPDAVGLDLSLQELRRARGAVCGRAQQLPFRERSFAAVTCHLAFMLFDDVAAVVGELARVLKPGAPFIALLGGGPTADGDDAFHRFAALVPRGQRFGDPRASHEAGWHELFAGWRDISFERWPLDLGGSFDEVWRFLASSYQLRDAEAIRNELRAAYPGDHVPCTVVTFCATARR